MPTASLPLGILAQDPRNKGERDAYFSLSLDDLCTSALIVGPTGSGKTYGLARPILNHVLAAVQAGEASVVVVDPKGDDFLYTASGYDYYIDIESDTTDGFSLFGGQRRTCLEADFATQQRSVAAAADRLASALLPRATDRTAFFVSASKNALYYSLAPFVAATHEWPTIEQLIRLLEGDLAIWQSVNDKLRNRGLEDRFASEMMLRSAHGRRRDNPASNLVEAVGELYRPHIVRILDKASPKLFMSQLNEPCAVHIALPYAQSPVAARILGRLVLSQFVEVCSSRIANKNIYKFLICDESSQFIDDYAVAGVRIVRSNRGGLIFLTQSLVDLPVDLRDGLFATVGNKFACPGLGPQDARLFSEFWGTRQVIRTQEQRGQQQDDRGKKLSGGMSWGLVEEPVWSPSYLSNEVPRFHCVGSRSSLTGDRRPARLVDMTRS